MWIYVYMHICTNVLPIYYVASVAATRYNYCSFFSYYYCGGDIIHLITSAKSCENPKMYGNSPFVAFCVSYCPMYIGLCVYVCLYVCSNTIWGSFSIILIIYYFCTYYYRMLICVWLYTCVCVFESTAVWKRSQNMGIQQFRIRFIFTMMRGETTVCVRLGEWRLLYERHTTTTEIKCLLIVSIHSIVYIVFSCWSMMLILMIILFCR